MKTFEQLKQQAVAIRDAVNKNENSAERVGAHLLDTVEKMESLEITDVAEAVLEAEAAAAEAKKQADIASQSGEIAQKAKEQGDIAEQKGNEADAAAQRANEAADQVTNKVLFKIPQDLSEEEQAQVKRNIGLQNAIAGLITLPITDFSAKVNATTATKTVDNIIPSGISFLIVDIGVVEGDSSTPTSPELSAVLCPVSGGGRIVFQGTASTKFENFKISVISGSAEKDGMGVEVSTPRSITYKVFQVRYLTEADSASFKGSFNSSGILQLAYPTARPGDYAYVGNPRHLYEWDSSAWQDRGLYITDVDQALDIDSGKAIANKAVAVKLSELNNKLIPIEEVRLNGVYINPFEKSSGNGETLLIAKKFDSNYISSGATISPTSSYRAVAKYKVNRGETIHVIIPKNGNEYSITYAYFNDLDGTVGTKPSDGGIVGSETRFEKDIVVENYPYIGFTYTTGDGEPVVTRDKKTLGQNDVEKIVKEETSLVESKLYTNGVDIILPDKFIAVKNDDLQIFWKSIIKSVSPYSFGIISRCSIGKHYPRYYSLLASAATSSVGQEKELTVEVLDNNYNDIAVNKTIIKIIDVPVSPSENKNILCVGASATENGQWPNELRRRLTKSDGDGTSYNPRGLGLTNIEFVGRRKATVQNIQLEATGGWSVKGYSGIGQKAYRFFVSNVTQLYIGDKYDGGGATFTITEINVTEGSGNIRCTYVGSPSISESGALNKSSGTGDSTIAYTRYESESYNPFYNEDEERLDFKKYADKYCNGSIDLFLWHCGVNDIFSGTQESITDAIEAYKKILRAYHADFPNGKVIISSVPLGDSHGGFGANYGASLTSNYYIFARQVFEYTKQLILLCKEEEFSSYTYYCPVMEEFDSENSYPSEQASVNNRIKDVKEKVGTNGVHPTMEGYYMVADSFYRTVCLVLNEVDKK